MMGRDLRESGAEGHANVAALFLLELPECVTLQAGANHLSHQDIGDEVLALLVALRWGIVAETSEVVLDLGVEDGRRVSAAIERELLECTNLAERIGVDGVFGDLGTVDGPSVLG
jgi:hypothetical protein